MKTTIDLDGKTHEITDHTSIIKAALSQLRGYRDDGRVPSKWLLWEIKLYEHILTMPDPESAAEEYLNLRRARFSKKEIADFLGWEIL